MNTYRPYLLARFTFDGYELSPEPRTDQEKVTAFFLIFRKEYCGPWNAHQSDQMKLGEYLSGLPGPLEIPFMNWEILDLARDMGGLPADASEAQEDRILTNYWRYMAAQLLKLRDALGVSEAQEVQA